MGDAWAPAPGREGLAERLERIRQRLEGAYGPAQWRPGGDPLEELVGTILSQHTSDVNSERAYRDLRRELGSWESIAAQPPERVARAIRAGGLAHSKAPRILAVLHALAQDEHGFDLSYLRDLDVEAARARLTRLHGVGVKTASCVLLFSLGLPAFPVDTHVHRVLRRLGVVGKSASADAATRLVESAVPPEQRYSLHMLLIRHGRRTCRALRPACPRCPLLDDCPTGNWEMSAGGQPLTVPACGGGR